MKIRYLRRRKFDRRTYDVGDVLDLPTHRATDEILRGHAEEVEEPKPVAKKHKVSTAAVVEEERPPED